MSDEKSYAEAMSLEQNVDDGDNNKKIEAALNRAHDIRKFEIDLYWKRALYFWGFQSVIFAGLVGITINIKGISNHFDFYAIIFIFLISYIGFLFSYITILANSGSKFWHANWENHIDFLESSYEGNLYKTVLSKKDKIHQIGFSPSSLNIITSYILLFFWFFILCVSLFDINQHYNLNQFSLFSFFLWGTVLLSATIFPFSVTKMTHANFPKELKEKINNKTVYYWKRNVQ